jgi:transcriptional regulator
MTQLKDYVENLQPPKAITTIDALDRVPMDISIQTREYTDAEGVPFEILVTTVNDEDYRVPISVLNQLKTLLDKAPDAVAFRVYKTGEGINTRYQVVLTD